MTSRERVVELRRAFEDSACEHDDFMCLTCCDDAIARAIDEAVAEAVKAEQEACAKVADDIGYSVEDGHNAFAVADTIRARGAK